MMQTASNLLLEACGTNYPLRRDSNSPGRHGKASSLEGWARTRRLVWLWDANHSSKPLMLAICMWKSKHIN